MRYRTVVDDTRRVLDPWEDEVIQAVTLDPDHDCIAGIRAVVEIGLLGVQEAPFELELQTKPVLPDVGSWFYKLYKPDAMNPGIYTLDFTTSTPAYPQLLRGDHETQTDIVELRAEHFQQPLEVLRSEITVLEF